jgi:hypothetical protein
LALQRASITTSCWPISVPEAMSVWFRPDWWVTVCWPPFPATFGTNVSLL